MHSSNTKIRTSLYMPLALCLAALVGCERTTQIGSGCVDGVCPQALGRSDEACTLTETVAEVAIRTLPGMPHLDYLCVGAPLPRLDDGTTNAHLYYALPLDAEPAMHCTDKAFLKPVSDAIRDQYSAGRAGRELCELNQLAVTEGDAGSSMAAGDGFYYDDFSQELIGCPAGMGLRMTEAARPWDGVLLLLSAVEIKDADGALDPSLACDPRLGTEPVGTPCLPAQRVYDDSQLVLETRAESCGDGVCMAYHLQGDTDPSCGDGDNDPEIEGDGGTRSITNGCAAAADIEARAYCTCRCDGPPGVDLCECPDGYACVDAVSSLAPRLEGRYCVKSFTHLEGP